MRYVALGDSVSIDLYTDVRGGGAASQFSRLIEATDFEDRTFDGATTDGVLERDFSGGTALAVADIVTLTVGGNDLLAGAFARRVGDRAYGQRALERTMANLETLGAQVATVAKRAVFNGIYDPTDGDDSLAGQLGLSTEIRPVLSVLNAHLQSVATRHGFAFCDLERLFHGHGFASKDPWLVMHIEPNLAGATAIARAWHGLMGGVSG